MDNIEKYQDLYKELKDAMVTMGEDSAEVESILDDMDIIWNEATDKEREEIDRWVREKIINS